MTPQEEEQYWQLKINSVVKVSTDLGFPELNREFWVGQPAVVLSLILELLKRALKRGAK